MKPMHRIIATVLVLAGPVIAPAQWNPALVTLPVTKGTDLRFVHLPLGVDPSHRRITGIVQDDLGFLWIGTDDGLKRYDGYGIREYRHDPKNANSLQDNYIITLFKDRSGKLWVASGRYLDVYDAATEKFTPFRADQRSQERFRARVSEINQDRAGTIWLSTDKGLYEVDPDGGVRFHYQHDAANINSLSNNVVRSTVEARDGIFWVATTAGVDSIDRNAHRVTRRAAFDMAHSVSSKIIEDHAGVLWLAYSGGHGPGLATVDRTTNALTHYRLIPTGDKVSSGAERVYEDADGNLWIVSSQGGLFMLDRGRTHFVRYRNNPLDPKAIASDELTELFEDREGGVWVGTYGDGIDRFTRKPLSFRRYVHEPGNPDSLEKDTVNAVFQDSRGFLWIGCVRSLAKVDPGSGKFDFLRSSGRSPKRGGLSSVYVSSIVEDRSGNLWFGTHHGGGLNRLDRKTGRFQVFRHEKNNPASLSNDAVVSLYVDRAGVLWAGTEDGLNAFDPKTQSFRVYPPPVRPSTYRRISEDPRGRLWLSSGWSGAHRFDPSSGKFTVYRHSDALGTLSSDAANAVCVDHAGVVWVGTQAGLNRLDPATGFVTVYNPGASTISIDSILEDSRGDLWLGTENGLARFDPRTKSFRHYYSSDGLAANELGFSAAWKNARGEMYFGSYGGLTVFDPARIVEDSYVPPVCLTDVRILGRPVAIGRNSPLQQSISVTNSFVLDHAQNTLSIEFSALSFADPARNRYRYRLEPVEKEWNEVDSGRRSVTYSELPAGDYVFRVLGSNSRGLWNEAGVRLAISILPPWWSSWYFRVAITAFCVSLLSAAYKFRMLQVQRESRRLRDVIETIPTYVWSAEPDGSVDFVNHRWLEFSGFSSAQALGWGWVDSLHPEDRDRFIEEWRAAVVSGQGVDTEARMRGAGGEYRWLLFRSAPLRDPSGRIVKWYGKSTDIEDRKRAEQERDRLRDLEAQLAHTNRVSMMGELAASVAHEVNQPLTGIVSNGSACLRLLARESSPGVEEVREAIGDIVRDGKRAGEVIARVRAMTKKAALPRERLDLNEVIREVLVLVGDEARKRSVGVRTEFAGGLSPVSADRVQLQQVVLNLAMNAMDAMSSVTDRQRQLVIHTRNMDDGQVRVTVEDSGVGLDTKAFSKIFEPFYTTKSSGMGMGLSICRSIVQSHGGRLWATANDGPGTSFHFTLPAYQKEISNAERAG